MEAYIARDGAPPRRGQPLDVHSVASFFVSRVDSEVDKRLEALGRDDLRGRAGAGQRPRRVPRVPGGLRRRALRRAARRRLPGPAAAVGVDRRQEPALPGDPLRGRAGRPRHRQHDAAADAARGGRARGRRARRRTRTRRRTSTALARGGDRPRRRHRAAAAPRASTRSSTPMSTLLAGIEQRRRRSSRAGRRRSAPTCPELGEAPVAATAAARRDEDVVRRIWRRDGTLWAPEGTPELADRLGWLTIADKLHERASAR